LQRRAELESRMELSTCDGCDGCGLRCMDGVTVTKTEWDAITDYLATQPPEEVRRVARQNKIIPWPGAEDSGATVTYCRFRDLEKNNCSIYPARPTICRLLGHTHWLPCPIEVIQSYPVGGADIWNHYRQFERRTFHDWLQEELPGALSNE
jgi:uncharacterized cysteine cluster protein YcgN (CxxCxxCC family)